MAGPYRRFSNFNQVGGLQRTLRFDFFWCDAQFGTSGSPTQIGSMYFGENLFYDTGLDGPGGVGHIDQFLINVYAFGSISYGKNIRIPFAAIQTYIQKYDSLFVTFSRAGSDTDDRWEGTLFLPDIDPTVSGTWSFKYLQNDPRTYSGTDGSVLCGSMCVRDYSDSVAVTDTPNKSNVKVEYESIPLYEFFRQNPKVYPIEVIPVSDSIQYTTLRHGTITDWNFTPNYKVLFQDTNQVGSYATTSWDINVKSFGRISKSVKHYTGDFEIGEWNPQLADPINELFGSLYATRSDSRYLEVKLMAMIADKPLTYFPQYTGFIDETAWQDGILSMVLRDKINNLPFRSFIWDYENLGTIKSNGQQIGIVKRISGTQVMFDDDGNINYIEVKSGGAAGISVVNTVAEGAMGYVAAGWTGLALDVGISLLSGLFSSGRQKTTGYWQLTDFNAIPDGVIRSGAKMKFYSGSICGLATNLTSPLAQLPEYTVAGGTFRNTQYGFNGTAFFANTNGIHVGDYIYVRKPMVFTGNPAEIIKGILCGSNIDVPFGAGTGKTSVGFFGSLIPPSFNDFATNFDSELNTLSCFNLGKVITTDVDTNPFDEIKELVRDLQISFYIDENNKFSVRAIGPRNLISAGTEAFYQEGQNILEGFQWKRSTQDALIGISIYYNYVGNGVGAFLNGYDRLIQIQAPNPIQGAQQWGTIESKWIRLDDDAQLVAYRTLVSQQNGIDWISLPTTLYGLIHSITDVIKVSHRTGSLTNQLFELESYDKSLDSSRVTLTGVNLSRVYGYGNCLWTGTSIAVTNGTQSGWDIYGFSSLGSTLGTLTGTLLAGDLYIDSTKTNSSVFSSLINKPRRWIGFGSNAYGYTELCLLGYADVFDNPTIAISRGMFNTIPRAYLPGETIYDLGNANFDKNGNPVLPTVSGFGTFINGTSYNLATNIGTAFKFF